MCLRFTDSYLLIQLWLLLEICGWIFSHVERRLDGWWWGRTTGRQVNHLISWPPSSLLLIEQVRIFMLLALTLRKQWMAKDSFKRWERKWQKFQVILGIENFRWYILCINFRIHVLLCIYFSPAWKVSPMPRDFMCLVQCLFPNS